MNKYSLTIRAKLLFEHPAFSIFFVLFFPLLIEHSFSDFVRGSELNSRIGWFFIILALALLLRKKIIPYALLAIFLISGSMDTLYAVTFGGVFTPASFEAIALTDSQEAVGFLSAYASFTNLSILTLYLAASIYFLSITKIPVNKTRGEKIIVWLGALMLTVAIHRIGFLNSYADTIPGFIGTSQSFYVGHETVGKETRNRKEFIANNPVTAAPGQKEKKQTYLIVIGESLSRKHMGLYGYHRDTTPELSKLSTELLVFNNAITPYVQTQSSLRHMLTQKSTDNNLSAGNALSMIDIANKAGFKTWWISNQQPLRPTTSAIAHMADETQFISNDRKGVVAKRYDGYLIPYVTQAIEDDAPRKAIFVHLMGNHLQYDNRYPENFSHFKDNDTKGYKSNLSTQQTDYVNSYDNSVLYTDNIITKMLGTLKKTSRQNGQIAASILFADHGEEVFDSRDFVGHGPDSVTPPMVEIPLIVWASDSYRQIRPQHIMSMQKNLRQPFTLDDVFHFVADLMGVESQVIHKNRSLSSNTYTKRKRMVYGKNYDLEIKRK